MNLLTIYPYLLGSTWVFDDSRTGLKEERCFKTDENLPVETADDLRRVGHDAVTVADR